MAKLAKIAKIVKNCQKLPKMLKTRSELLKTNETIEKVLSMAEIGKNGSK